MNEATLTKIYNETEDEDELLDEINDYDCKCKNKTRKKGKNKFNKHQINLWVDKGIYTKSNNQSRIDKRNTKGTINKMNLEILKFENNSIKKAKGYRKELVPYIGKHIKIIGKIINIKRININTFRITLGDIKINSEKVKFDHINVIVNLTWMNSNDECKIGSTYEFRGITHEYLKANGTKNIGLFVKTGKLINECQK